MTTLILTRGIPASGKTTWAKAWVSDDPAHRARSNRDDIRTMLFGPHRPLSNEQECIVSDAETTSVKACLKRGISVVVDDMNLRQRYVTSWAELAAQVGAELIVREFAIDVDEAVARDAQRVHPVGATVIRDIAQRLTRGGVPQPVRLDPRPAVEPYEAPDFASVVVLCDIDGTLAIKGDRSPYDWSRVGEDTRNTAVVRLLNELSWDGDSGLPVIFLSGRDESCREATEAWLREHTQAGAHLGDPESAYTPWAQLLMRPAGDFRNDAVVKRELFDQHIRGKYDVLCVLDDRDRVVDMWRDLGLLCLQVERGDF